MSAMDGRAHPDMGGLPAGRCSIEEHEYEQWEKRIDALLMTLWLKAGAFTVDELRRNIEELGQKAYDGMTYYERWMHAITECLLQRGLITVDELSRALEGTGSAYRPADRPQFKAGDRVSVRRAAPLGHVRTPWYCRGHSGVVTEFCGSFRNPEELAFARSGEPKLPLYRVRFRSVDLWPGYDGSDADTVDIEIYENWLESVR